jgi:kynurenine formamidase
VLLFPLTGLTLLRRAGSAPAAVGPGLKVMSAIGALEHVDDAKRLEALALVREGRVYDLSHALDETVPVFPGRSFHQTLVTTAHHANGGGLGDNQVNWITEVYSSTSQLGTHLDSLAHLQRGGRGYGGIAVDELAGVAGVTQLGAETIPQIVTRGWLVDVAPLGPGEVITPDPVAHISPSPGDAVLFHTGWVASGTTPRRTWRASRDRAWSSRTGSLAGRRPYRMRHVELWTGAGRGSGAAVRSTADPERRPRRLRRREPRPGTARDRRSARVLPGPHPPEAARRYRSVDRADRPRLREEHSWLPSTTT